MNSKAIIFGHGGQSRIIHSFIQQNCNQVLFATTSGEGVDLTEEHLIAQFDDYATYDFYVAIGDNFVRRCIFKKLKALGAKLPALVGPNAYVSPAAEIGAGVFLGVGVSVVANAKVLDNAIISVNSSISHDSILREHSHMASGVTITGHCDLGVGCFIGVASSIIPNVHIGEYSFVMAGAVVTKSVPAFTQVGGVPARFVKNLPQETAVIDAAVPK
jgi:acetyltransferase EpsM